MEPNIYLFFQGNCFEAMNEYARVLGGQIDLIVRNADAPGAESRMPGGDDLIMHMSMKLGQTTLMASDNPPEWYREPQGFSVSIQPSSLEEFERVFSELSADARSISMPPAETFWAERFAMFTDKYGTPWMLDF